MGKPIETCFHLGLVAELTRGTIADRPWGLTLAALDKRGFSGQLTLFTEDHRQFAIAFERGAVIGATSPVATDAIVRIALTNHLIPGSQVNQLMRRIAAEPGRDEIDVLVELAHLSGDQEIVLRERAILVRAARSFSCDRGTFTLDDEITIATSPCSVDIRAVIYYGTRLNLAEQRLVADRRWMGSHFRIRREAQDELMRYGFGAEEQPIIAAAREGTDMPELEATQRDLDSRTASAVLFTLAACGTAVGGPGPTTRMPALRVPGATGSEPSIQRIRTPMPLVAKVPASAVRAAPPPPADEPTAAEEWMTIGTPTNLAGRRFTPMPEGTPLIARTVSPVIVESAPSYAAADVELLDLAAEPEPEPVPAVPPDVAAKDAFKRGQSAMRSDLVDKAISELGEATRLAPDQADYAAMLAWAKFVGTADKAKVADDTRQALTKAKAKAQNPVMALFLLGRVERILGRDREALHYFQEVLQLQPRNIEAQAEIRVIELRAAEAKPAAKSSLFRRRG